MADPMTWVVLASAVIGAGSTVYTQNKAEDAQDKAAAVDATRKKEAMDLGQTKEAAARNRASQQAAQKDAGNQMAFEGQMDAMQRSAEAEKRAQEEARLANAQNPDVEYAAKFKPGSGEGNDGSAMDFLVPRIADNTGLVANKESTGGLSTPLGFDV